MRVVLCDDHALFVEAMGAALRAHGVDVVGIAGEPESAVVVAAGVASDICLLDVGFPGDDGIAAIDRILRAAPNASVVMMSAASDASSIAAALAAGARGFLSKTLDLEVVLTSLERVLSGEIVVLASSPVQSLVPSPRKRSAGEGMLLDYLTDRELDVLRRLMRGDSTTKIAESLGTARSTTRTHIQNVLAKLGAHSRREAVAFAVRHGISPLALASEVDMVLSGAADGIPMG